MVNPIPKNQSFLSSEDGVVLSWYRPEYFRDYVVDFKHDNFHYRIEGKNLEFIKQEIVRNCFPEYDYDEMFLVSSTVK